MTVFNLPDDIFLNKAETQSPIIIHHYTATASHFRERSILHRNAVSLVISGQKTIQFAEAAVDTNDSEIHFLSSGNSISSFDISKQQAFESILIFFDDKVLADFSVVNASVIEDAQRKYQPISNRYVSIKKDDFIHSYIRSMQLIVASEKQISAAFKRIKLYELLLYLLEFHAEKFLAFINRSTVLPNEMKIRKVAEGSITENLSIEEMAFLCNVSASTFKRQFQKIYHTSPTTWFAEQKMKLAAQLLTSHKEKPGEIWFRLGYESHSNFTRSFKKHFGVSPKDFTEKMTHKEQLLS